ncbi:MAG: MFS transporter [Gammaproteobacteria bacterium AqS3]|nr:MFS transporter [Gammaproteobacteria bacterium AqS3]
MDTQKTTSTGPESQGHSPVYPWLVAGFGLLALLVSNGFTITGVTAFDNVLLAEFGWERSEYKVRDFLTLMFAGLFAPIAGVFLDRYGVRKCMLVGWAVLIASQLTYAFADSLMMMYALHVLFAVVLVLCGLNASVIVVSNWFVDNRGKAIGLVLVGTSLGGAMVSQFNTSLIELIGWRSTFQAGAVFPVILLLLTWLWLRDAPDEAPPAPARQDTGAAPADEGMAYSEAIRTASFWMLSLIAMATFFTVLGVQQNMLLHLTDMGYSAQGATFVFGLFFWGAIVGKFLFGLLSDYLKLRMVFNLNIVVMLAGMLMLASMSETLLYIAVVAFGFGWGGAYTMIQLSVVNIFGLVNAGKILGTITVLDALGGAIGIYAVARMQEVFGSYQIPFYLCAGLIFFALLCFTQVRFRTQ